MVAATESSRTVEPTAPPTRDAERITGKSGLAFLVRTQGALLAIACTCAALSGLCALVPYATVAWMAAAIFASPPDLALVQELALVALGAIVVRHVLAAIATAVAHIAAFRLLHDLRVRLARKLGEVPMSFFAKRPTGELKQTMMDDVNQIEAFVAHHLPDATAAIVTPVAIGIVLFVVDWRMALASVAMGPFAIAAMTIAMRNTGEAHRRWRALLDRIANALLEYFRGIHVIKTFGLTARSFGDLEKTVHEGMTWTEDFMRTNGRGYGAFGALIGSSVLVLAPLGGWLYLRGSLALDTLVLFLVLGPQLLSSMLRLMFAWGNVERITQGNARIASVLAAPALETRAEQVALRDASIAFDDVSFAYDAGDVLQHVSFEARPGEITALVGPSGAGKTTIARLIPRLWEPTGGRIEIGGVDIAAAPLDAVLERIAVVFQDVFLFHGTIAENLRIARPDASDADLVFACEAAGIHATIRALPRGYETILGERGARLSGGEKQRLSIARAILKDAPIVILDEATAFADPENESVIQEALSTLCRGKTVIVIAHRLSTVRDADQIIVLDRGRVVDRGTHAELIARCSTYQRLSRDHDESLAWSLDAAVAP
jgi:ATP-binding cassette subfamily B protein